MNMDYSAYEGFEIDGKVDTVLSRGTVVIDDDALRRRARGTVGSSSAACRSTSCDGRDGRMDFGVVLQTTRRARGWSTWPKKAETYGFSHVWTFDSHLLWQEPFAIYTQILARHAERDRRADGHQPRHPRLDRHRVACSRR